MRDLLDPVVPGRLAPFRPRFALCGRLGEALAVLFLGAPLALSPGCDSSEPGDPDHDAPAAASSSPEARTVGTIRRPHEFSPGLSDKLARQGPSAELHPGEAAAGRAQSVLDRLASDLISGRAFEARGAADYASPDFQCSFEAREAGTVVHQTSALQVTRAALLPTPEEGAQRGPAAFLAALQVLLGRTQVAPERSIERVSFETDRVTLHGASSFRTVSQVRVVGNNGAGRWQQNAHWIADWRDVDDGLRMTRLQVLDLEDVDAPGPLFADATLAVLGGAPALRDVLTTSVERWNGRLDKALGPSVFGHNGLAVGDVNGDGRADLYACQPGALPNQLWIQNEDGTASDLAARAGVDVLDLTRSALLLDLDNDADADLVLGTSEELIVFENAGDATFSLRWRTPLDSIFSLCAADVDGDAQLDLYVCRYSQTDASTPTPYHDANEGPANALLRNRGSLDFEDATEALGLSDNNHRYSFAASFADADLDGDLDLYVANDFGRNNYYINEGGRFRDAAREIAAEDIAAGMSVSWGDYDRDGRFDLYVGNMYSAAGGRISHQPGFREDGALEHYQRHARGNTLLRNASDRRFEDASVEAHATLGRWAWASMFADLDNDGWLDLAVANGYLTAEDSYPGPSLCSYFWREVVGLSPATGERASASYNDGWLAINELQRHGMTFAGHERNVLYANTQDGRFSDVSGVTGFDVPDDARGLSFVDWDRDGRLDVWQSARTAPRLRLLRNTTPAADDFLCVKLQGTRSNRDAVGARVTLSTSEGTRLVRQVVAGDGFLAQSTLWLSFGLGSENRPTEAEVVWPDGQREVFADLERGARYLLVEGSGEARLAPMGSVSVAMPEESVRTARQRDDAICVRLAAPVPALGLTTTDDTGAERVIEAHGRPLCVVLVSPTNDDSFELLRDLQQSASTGSTSIDLLAVVLRHGKRPYQLLDDAGWTHQRALADERLLTTFDVYRDTLFAQPVELRIPGGFVLDAQNRMVAVFRGRVPAPTLLAASLTADLSPEERRAQATPFAGRWLAPPPQPQVLALAAALRRYGFTAAARAGLERMYVPDDNPGARRQLADARELLGRSLLENGDPAGAIAEFEACLELEPGRAKVLVELGNALRSVGRDDEAAARFDQAVVADPENGDAHYSVGLIHALGGRLEQAKASFEEAVRFEPTNELAHFNLAVARANTGDVPGAVAPLERALELRPDYAQATQTLGRILLQSGDAHRAVSVYRAGLQHTPDDPGLTYELGRALVADGALDDARLVLMDLERLSTDLAARLQSEIDAAD